jgi:periplasmic protein TonB
MQAPQPVSAGVPLASSDRPNSRALTITAVVAAVHVALLAVIMTLRHEPVEVALGSQVMTAELLPPAPPAKPVMLQSIAPPPPQPTPPVHTKPKVQPTPKPVPTPTPLPQAAAPSPTPVAAPDPTPPAPAAPAPPPAAAAPAIGKPTMEIVAPKNVAHADCNIAQPDYPMLSKRRHETGAATVRFVIETTGKIGSIELVKSSGFSRLDDAALATVRAGSCKPYIENGQAVPVRITQPVTFNLDD